MLLLRRSGLKRGLVAYEHDLSYHASLPQQLVRLSGLPKRISACDQWLNLLLLKKVKQATQILSEPDWSQPFEPLDAVGNDPLSAWEKPSSSNIESKNAEGSKSMTTA